jgi:hypothetical protein
MVRRFLLMGAMLLLLVLCVPACGGGEDKTKEKGPAVPDPEGNAKPALPGKGAKAG